MGTTTLPMYNVQKRKTNQEPNQPLFMEIQHCPEVTTDDTV
jgi:hypothetical protein